MTKKLALIILDGWGIGDGSKSDAIRQASTPMMDALLENYPYSHLLTSGENVGLPEGQMGNSEVGHLNLGAGRVVYQDLVRINKEIKEDNFKNNRVLINAFSYAKEHNKDVHFLGLLSEGGVHSSQKHLEALCDMAKSYSLTKVFIHAFTDGRDTDPKSGLGYIANLTKHLTNSTGEIASVIGRYYAMDRDKRWERIKLGYDLLVHAKGEKTNNLFKSIEASYHNGITDEFIKPLVITDDKGEPLAKIKEGDVVICFNFRTDRCREITIALTQKDMPEYNMQAMNLHYVTMANYDDRFKNIEVIYNKDNLKMTLGEVISKQGKSQLRIAETEKYPHVTFFFSGGREEPFKGEKRILINSPKVATYD